MTAWYVVQTKARAEWGLHADLRALGYRTLYLHYAGTVRHARRVIGVIKPYFPRYLFVAIDKQILDKNGQSQSIGPVNEHRLTAEIICNDDGPVEIPFAVIAELASRADGAGKVGHLTPDQRKLIESGVEVRITAGAFAGFLATVRLDEGPQIRIWLEVFGRPTEAAVRPSDIERVSPNGGGVPEINPVHSRWPRLPGAGACSR